MREIKFRAWDTENSDVEGKMHYFNTMQVCDNGLWFNNDSFDLGENHCDDENAVVMQYTGLYNLYEGDIIDIESSLPSKFVISFIEGAFCIADIKTNEYVMDIHYIHHAGKIRYKIIGNIFENPELLKP